MSEPTTLVCVTCRKRVTLFGSEPIIYGHQLAKVALDTGWQPVTTKQALLLFCDDQCLAQQLTKKGNIRKKLRYVPKLLQPSLGPFPNDNNTDVT